MNTLIVWLVDTISRLGYAGIIALMFLESSFFPFPSEVVVPPAGYLASKGEMNIILVIISGLSGSILGALFNYFIAFRYGRPLLIRYGQYIFLPREKFDRVNDFFVRHGEISTFTCRLIPGIRQYISFPAGLARMNVARFVLYTGLGAGIWVVILAYIGYVVGNNVEMVEHYSHEATVILFVFVSVLVVGYMVRFKSKRKKNNEMKPKDY